MLARQLGDPWSVRLAGRGSGCPARWSCTRPKRAAGRDQRHHPGPPLLRGGRATAAGPRAIAWGLLPAGPGRGSASARAAAGPIRCRAVLLPADWCWVAISDGRFGRVMVRSVTRAVAAAQPGQRVLLMPVRRQDVARAGALAAGLSRGQGSPAAVAATVGEVAPAGPAARWTRLLTQVAGRGRARSPPS